MSLKLLIQKIKIEEEEEENWKIYANDPEVQLQKKLKIKLIITDIHHDSKIKRNLRQIMSPILDKLEMLPEFGMFHTALGNNY